MNVILQTRCSMGLLKRPRASTKSGLTLVEIAITLSILITILLSFSEALLGSMKASRANRETAVATDAARQMMETLQATDFADVFAANNSVAGDDPVAVTARLAAFAVPGLQARPGDADGLCGQIIFPEGAAGGIATLLESAQQPVLNMPRDLNGDGIVDGLDHSGDYLILPVIVRVDWRGSNGSARVQFKTILSGF